MDIGKAPGTRVVGDGFVVLARESDTTIAATTKPRTFKNGQGNRRKISRAASKAPTVDEQDEFAFEKPSRRRFRDLLEFPRTYGEIMPPRASYSHLRALFALILGYDHLHLLNEARMR